MSDHHGGHETRNLGLALAALGVVYGDIGTSPLYAFRESLGESYGLDVSIANVLGIVSLIFWSLMIVISIKYIAFVMRADNDGEGGILALTALIMQPGEGHRGRRRTLILFGLFGTALLYGDGAITPAISVLSAVEGLKVATPVFDPYVIPIAIAILVGLFSVQRKGTAAVGSMFGPVMVVWFAVLSVMGVAQILQHPAVLKALSPSYAVAFFTNNPWHGFLSLGSIFLVVTGGEALFADLGHFGIKPIRRGWFAVVLPGLVLNYMGQGALLITTPDAVDNPFFRMAPPSMIIPLVVLSTAATIIASQALISGAFSLTMQAVRLDYLPRMRILHTSDEERGQVYLAGINWALMVACIGLVIGFGSSSNLAGAYGVAVTTTMVITTLLFYVVARHRWGWNRWLATSVCGGFLLVDLAFFGANLFKIPAGGWFPLLVGLLIFGTMTTWQHGREVIRTFMRRGETVTVDFVASLTDHPQPRVRGTAVYMFPDVDRVPPALLTNLRANHSLHETVVLLAVKVVDKPRVLRAQRADVVAMGAGFYAITLTYGFADEVDVPKDLATLVREPVCDPVYTTYFLGRESVSSTDVVSGMARWRERLFALLHRNASSAADFFGLPHDKVFEIGSPVDI
jgi:KUP system potassium uptake protein